MDCAMKTTTLQLVPADIDALIVEARGQKVILDADLAKIYGVSTKALNQAVKRNGARFPDDFVFRLKVDEIEGLNRSQFVTGSQKHRDPRFTPYAFTEHGAIMAANTLNSHRAVDMSVFVVRAFVKMRSAFGESRELARKLALLEQELKIRLNIHEAAIVDVLQRIMRILDPPPAPPGPPPPEIGFHVKEEAVPYLVKRKAVRA
jgi:ORF6N domain-containing protein